MKRKHTQIDAQKEIAKTPAGGRDRGIWAYSAIEEGKCFSWKGMQKNSFGILMNAIAPSDVPGETKEEMRAALMQKGFKYKFEWGAEGAEAVAEEGAVAVILDVLSFTTTVDVAVSRGAEIIPFSIDDRSIKARARKLGAIVAQKRGHGPITLSPSSMEKVKKGQRIMLRSQNGAILSLIAKNHYKTVIAASLRNADAVAAFIKRLNPRLVCFIAGGERWRSGSMRVAFEDIIGAGAVLGHFRAECMSPEAKAAVSVFKSVKDLYRELSALSSGRELIDKGYADDVRYASMLNVSRSVPVLVDGAYKNRA